MAETNQTIILDCPPGFPRPGDLIEAVIKDTGLPLRETTCMIMGEWTWNYSDIDRVIWDKANPIVAERIKALYDRGIIRYGAW